jgi:hypothetical protein
MQIRRIPLKSTCFELLSIALDEKYPLVSDLKLVIHVYKPSRQTVLDEFSANPDGERERKSRYLKKD